MQRFPVLGAALLAGASLLPAQTPNSAILLNGVDAYGSAGGVGGLVTNSTWEAWVWIPQNTIGGGPVLMRWGMYSHALSIDAITGQVGVDMYSCWTNPCPQASSAPGALQREHWHHIAIVYGPEAAPSCNAYLDGNLVAWCGAQQCAPYAGWETVLGAFGYIGYSSFLNAAVDEARISDVPRYSGPFVPSRRFSPDSHTVGLWHFDEGSGSVAHDSSGHGLDFALHGGYQWVEGNVTQNAAFLPFGTGCQGSVGVPELVALNGALPRLDSTFVMRLQNLPQAPVFVPLGYLGYSNTETYGVPLPVSLGVLGMPASCQQYVALENATFYTLANQGGVADWVVPIPNAPQLDGASVYVQALVFDWNLPFSFPAVVSNGAEMRFGY